MSDEDSPTSHDIQIEDHRNSIKPAVKIVVSTKASPKHKSTKLSHVFMVNGTNLFPEHLFVPSNYVIDNKHRHIHIEYKFSSTNLLHWLQRIFIAAERPKSCKIALLFAVIINICIFLGVICYVISNDQNYFHVYDDCKKYHAKTCKDEQFCPKSKYPKGRCEPTEIHELVVIEDIILYIFTAEYFIRILLVIFVPARVANLLPEDHDKLEHEVQEPDPVYTWHYQFLMYVCQWKCLIDVATIIPFYVFLGASQGSASFNFIRVLRLTRVLHIFKLTKENAILHLLERTMWLSAPALSLVAFVSGLGMVLIGSIIYFFEGGTFKFTSEFPDGTWYRLNPLSQKDEVTPFVSIAASMYYTLSIATGCAVGDLVPYTAGGQAITNITQILGIIITAIPIGVIGSNFSHEYDAMQHTFKKHAGLIEDEDHHAIIKPLSSQVTNETSSSNKIVPFDGNDIKDTVKEKLKILTVKMNALHDELRSLTKYIEEQD